MINQNIFKILALCLIYFLLLLVDGLLGVHTLSIGFLLCLAFFVSKNQVFLLVLLLTPFHDVRFMLPFGLTAVVVLPFVFSFTALVRIIRSRMALLYVYLTLVSVLLSLVEFRQFIKPQTVILNLISAVIFVVVVYFYAIRRYQDFSFSTKAKPLQF
jgi:hypothetical protein